MTHMILWDTEQHKQIGTHVYSWSERYGYEDNLAEYDEDMAHRLRLGLVVWKDATLYPVGNPARQYKSA